MVLVIRDVKAIDIPIKNIVHVRLEDVEWSIGFPEKLLSFAHPIFVPFLLVQKIQGPHWFRLEILNLLRDFSHLDIRGPLPVVETA